jgi:hypothetical protein
MFTMLRQFKRLWMRPGHKDRRGIRPAAAGKSSPGLEVLEDRVQPSTFSWTGQGSDNLMSNGQNWLGGTAPSAGADLYFGAGAFQLIIDDDLGGGFNSITVADGYSISGQPLTVADLTIQQGALELATSATVIADLEIAAGGRLLLDSGTALHTHSGATVSPGGELDADGAIVVEAGNLQDNGAIYSFGQFTAAATVFVGQGGALVSSGTMTVNPGGSVNTLGTVTVQGTCQIMGGGGVEVNSGGTLDDQGTVTITTATTEGLLIDQGTVAVDSNAILDDQGFVDVTGQLKVTDSGTMKGAGTVKVSTLSGSLILGAGSTLDDYQGTVKVTNHGTLDNQGGTITVAASALLSVDGGYVGIEPGGWLDAQGGMVALTAQGFLEDQQATVTVETNAKLTVDAQSTVEVAGDQSTPAIFIVSGIMDLSGTLDDGSPSGVTVATGGMLTVNPSGKVTVYANDTLAVQSGAMDIAGRVTVSQGSLTVAGAATVTVDSGPMGTSGGFLDDGGTVTVNSGGTLFDFGDVGVTANLNVSGGTMEVSGTFENVGSAIVESGGRLTVDDTGQVTVFATHTLAVQNGAFLDIAGKVVISGSLQVAGAVIVDSNGGTLDDIGTITVQAGVTVDVFGTVTVENNATLDVAGMVILEVDSTYNPSPFANVIQEPGGYIGPPM